MANNAGQAALAALDKVLADTPHKVGHDFSASAVCLCALRDEMIEQHRPHPTHESRERLSRMNAVISVVVGGHFPLGHVPWPAIERARQSLADLVQAREKEAIRSA